MNFVESILFTFDSEFYGGRAGRSMMDFFSLTPGGGPATGSWCQIVRCFGCVCQWSSRDY